MPNDPVTQRELTAELRRIDERLDDVQVDLRDTHAELARGQQHTNSELGGLRADVTEIKTTLDHRAGAHAAQDKRTRTTRERRRDVITGLSVVIALAAVIGDQLARL